MRNLLLGVDVGTTGAKAMLFDEEGRILGAAAESYPLLAPGVGRCEQRPMDWWNAVVRIVRRLCPTPELAQSVRGLSLSTQGGTVVPVDENFEPLANAIVWSDARCAGDRPAFEEALGRDYIYRTCGWKLNVGLPAMQLRRLRLENPALFDRAAWFLTVPDFVAAKLTGRPAVDLSNAGINHLADVKSGCYDRRILEFVGVDESRLAALTPSCQPVGTLTRGAAEALGLPESVVVTSGAHDQYAVALGAGICESGDAVIGTGTAWVVTALRDVPDFESGFAQSVSATAGKWGTMLSITTGGVCLDWFRKQIAGEEGAPLDYDRINELAARRDEPGARGVRFYPYFNGAGQPEPDAVSRATLMGLDLSHDRGDVIRAIMEGVGCQIVWALRTLEKRQPVARLVLAGGATKSPVWTHIIAEIAGRTLTVPSVPDLACAGAAMMAGVGCGVFHDTAEAAARIAPAGRTVEPDPARVGIYQKLFEEYCRGARGLRTLYRED